jgi:hypothetical protein
MREISGQNEEMLGSEERRFSMESVTLYSCQLYEETNKCTYELYTLFIDHTYMLQY